ncbi:MAG: ribonuclease J [Clostridiales bacterium]|nr:ribonuclease J [Clostridiales bacterium]
MQEKQENNSKKRESKSQKTGAVQKKKRVTPQKPQARVRKPATGKPRRSVGRADNIKVTFLGGLNEIGKNITAFEYDDEIIIVDCGLAFPDQDLLGVDIVLPDFTFLEQNADKIKGVFVTHGHEDHIGGLPYLLKNINVPIFGTRLTIGLIRGKLREHGLLRRAKLNTIHPGEKIDIGKFNIECIHVNHSIPDALAFAIRCKAGTIVHTGDFKIDSTPIDGEIIDLAKFAQLGSENVLCMLSDSTNAERPGFAVSESKVGESFEMLFNKAEGKRIIIATFASNIHRVQQIIDVSHSLGKKVALSGRSLENVVGIAKELGYLNIPDDVLIPLNRVRQYDPGDIVVATTGSQGEPMSALARMAFSEHRNISITENDYVIISATPIPGNEKTVNKVINELMKLGAEVVYEKMYDVHVSGHACQDELKLLLGIVKPKYFIPVHGELKHLKRHADLAKNIGMPSKNILLLENGNVVQMSNRSAKVVANVPAGRVLVDGYGVGDVGNVVLRDRKHLAQDGLLIVAAAFDPKNKKCVLPPDVITRGFVYVKESEKLIEEARDLSLEIINGFLKKNIFDQGTIKARLRDDLSRLLYERTKRSPMVLPVLIEL